MTTTTDRDPVKQARLVAATTPYALSALSSHLIDLWLPTPEQIEVRSDTGITLWILAQDLEAWKVTTDHEPVTVETRTDRPFGLAPFDVHTMPAVLHCSAVRVTIKWTTPSDAVVCTGLDGTCTSIVDATPDEPGCAHGRDLCAEHRTECPDCVDDLRDDRGGVR